MHKVIVIAVGGALGALARYMVTGIDYRFSNGIFPVGTLVVNTTGSLLIGMLWGIFERFALPPATRLFIFVGILGGYTTFSTYALETLHLIRDGEHMVAAANIVLSNVLGIIAVMAGYFSIRLLMNWLR